MDLTGVQGLVQAGIAAVVLAILGVFYFDQRKERQTRDQRDWERNEAAILRTKEREDRMLNEAVEREKRLTITLEAVMTANKEITQQVLQVAGQMGEQAAANVRALEEVRQTVAGSNIAIRQYNEILIKTQARLERMLGVEENPTPTR